MCVEHLLQNDLVLFQLAHGVVINFLNYWDLLLDVSLDLVGCHLLVLVFEVVHVGLKR